MRADGNQVKYESGEVVSFYQRQMELQPSESLLFQKYVKAGLTILDLGVGGGRTTPHLSSGARRYVGADYSQGMIDACRGRFPGLEFWHCDATSMQQFRDGEFDLVVFSFNGIDYITDDLGRAKCLSEVARVLKPGGTFVFSSHNARQLGILPILEHAGPAQVAWRAARAALKSIGIAWRTLRSGNFAKGHGYIRDPVHGGLDTYTSTPKSFEPQLAAVGLRVLETVRAPYPSVVTDFLTSWHYYACRKDEDHA